MSPDGSVTHWLGLLRAGDRDAAGPLWQRYFRLLVLRARSALRGAPRRAADEEDVALSAFDSFCRGVDEGRFPRLDDRDDLWRVLVMLTARKAVDLRRHEGRQKRGGAIDADNEAVLAEVVGDEPTPEFAAEVADACRRLLARLDSPELEAVALAKMDGYSNAEIAQRLACSPRTVERRLELIRQIWQAENTS